ncbi:MAG: phosphorylase [Flavobacteriales bacterium]|nr:phosphorylase [Flavobacteriales bacterium]
MLKHFPATDLVLNAKNQVYHLGFSPENLATKIIVVGDQDRVGLISQFFDSIEHQSHHREFTCQTGIYQGKRISVLSTGIGTDNIDIVVNELDALVNIDLANRIEKEAKTNLEIIRIGTCGIVQSHIPIHSYILSSHALGLDNIAHFYEIPFDEKELALGEAIQNHIGLPAKVIPYLISANSELTNRLTSESTHQGITITSSGFYGPQGRNLRIPTYASEIHNRLSSFENNGLQILNFEMESSALFALGKALGHKCTTICLGVANRPNYEFSKGYDKEMNGLIEYVLNRI